MGTGFFNYIAQACQSLAATTAPTITAMGIRTRHSIGDHRVGFVRRAGRCAFRRTAAPGSAWGGS